MTLPANTEKPGTEPAPKENEISVVNGYPPVVSVLVVAPHAWNKFDGQDKNFTDGDYDALTGEIAKRVAEKIGCKALINWDWKKESPPSRNYNNKSDAEQDETFISHLKAVGGQETLVLWIHGIDDDNLKREASNKDTGFKGKPEELCALIGYGQHDKEPRETADQETVESLTNLFTENGMKSIPARKTGSDANGSNNYRALGKNNMCQWFNQQKDEKGTSKYPNVQSLQIEIKFAGFRDSIKSAERTAEIIETALRKRLAVEVKPEEEVDEELVEQAFQKISDIMAPHIYGAMTDTGEYIIKTFYGSHKRALNKKPLKRLSLNRLIERLHSTDKAVPGKSWIYNAVRLAVDEHYMDKEQFSTRGKYSELSRTIRVNLTHIKNWDTKKMLAEEALAKDYTVMELRERINEEKSKNQTPKVPFDRVLTKKELMGYELPVLEVSGQQAQQNKKYHQKKRDHFKDVDKIIQSAIKDKKVLANPAAAPKNSGFKDWTVKNFNICTGCSNDCVYCWAKEGEYRHKHVEKGHWQEQVIRPKDVEAPRKLIPGRVGFPSTHDINDDNLDAYLVVLGKLLKAGNEVLIVSKPRLNCIKRICDATEFFKKEIMFRFTICAMDDNILKLWEPNAPAYSERREALQYAYDNGFQTSVSVEPMLDATNIDALIKDLLPYVYDAIWLGTMNHINRVRMEAGENENLKKAIEAIEANQTDDRLSEIYKRHKENSKIKWKSSIKKVVGLEQPPIPGSDE